MSKPHCLLRCIAMLLGLAFLAACGPPEPLRLGFLAGLSGRGVDLGEAGRDGALLAVEQANAAGGIDGRKIELTIRDDGQQKEKALQAVADLAAARVEAVIGPMTSVVAMAIAPASREAGLLMVSPTVTTAQLSGIDDNFFKVVSTTREHSRREAEFLRARGYRRVAALYDLSNAAYTRDWLEDFSTAFTSAGGEMAGTESFTSGQEAGYDEALRKLGNARPDALLIIANAVDTVRLLQSARAMGLQQTAVGVTWAATEQLLELGGRTIEGMILTQFFDRDSQSPGYLAFRTAFNQRFRKEPGFAAVAAYDATRATLEALRHKGSKSLKDALLAGGPYEGVQERWGFDRYGDAQRRAYVTTIRAGRFVLVD